MSDEEMIEKKQVQQCKCDSGIIFEKLVHIATNYGLIVRFAPLTYNDGRLKGNRLALRQNMKRGVNYGSGKEERQ